MRFSEVLAASSVATLVTAHGDGPMIPKVFGMPKHLKSRNLWAGHQKAALPVEAPKLQVRQGGDANNRCGPNFGRASCAAGFCCSAEGYCGDTKEHCAAPDCLIDFGPGCDANKTPNGATTKNDLRPQLGNIAYGGVGIRSCVKPKTVAITYDDGPYIYTEDVLAEFDKYNAKATFFITGNNLGKGAIDENWQSVIQNMYSKGHQIASHTWSHQNLDQITSAQRYDQMVKNEMALRNILGKYPTYMRPPYSACDTAGCQADLKKLGYVITSFDLDTDDYNQLTVPGMEIAKGNFKTGIDSAKPSGNQLSIAHDIHELTAHNLTPYMLKYVYDNGFTAVTVGECMGDPVKNWYRDSTPAPPSSSSSTRSSSAPVPTPTGPTSVNGACGTVNPDGNGQSCIGFVGDDGLSECCSQYGWCGRSTDHCQTGCNPLFGKCGTQPSVSATPSASASVSLSKTSSGPVPTPTGPTSTNGACGTANPDGNGQSCIGFMLDGAPANCCSEYGYCGNTDIYCGATCDPRFGKCGTQPSGSVSQSASASASSTVSKSASSSASASASVSRSSSASVSRSSSASVSRSSSASVSRSSSASVSKSSSASVSKSSSASVSKSASASASISKSASASASASVSKSASSDVVKSSSASATISASSSAAQSSSASASVSQPASSSGVSASGSPSASASISSSATIVQVSSTPAPSSSKGASSTPIQPSASSPVVNSSSASSIVPTPSSSKVNPNTSTVSTVVRPSETPCSTSSSATPTPSKPVSKDGKCGKDNNGQTCAGYMNGMGWKVECCCKESGRCSTDPWACGVGCDKAYGNCFSY